MTPSPRYTIGRDDLVEIGLAGFAPVYVPEPVAEPRESLLFIWILAALSTAVMFGFMLGVGCLTGLACLVVGGA